MVTKTIQTGVLKLTQRVRWRLGMRVAAAELEQGTDESVAAFYSNRVTDCAFLDDPAHYEHPRARWVTERLSEGDGAGRGGRLLEVGCGNGGMTRLLSPLVDEVVALDTSEPSLQALAALGLKNVKTVNSLLERFEPGALFDWIVVSEVIEHLRRPEDAVDRCARWLAPGGAMLVTTPNGHWESDEHLHEFTLAAFAELLARTGVESVHASYLRDADNRRRWLVAELKAPPTPPAPDDFHDRRETARKRRSGNR